MTSHVQLIFGKMWQSRLTAVLHATQAPPTDSILLAVTGAVDLVLDRTNLTPHEAHEQLFLLIRRWIDALILLAQPESQSVIIEWTHAPIELGIVRQHHSCILTMYGVDRPVVLLSQAFSCTWETLISCTQDAVSSLAHSLDAIDPDFGILPSILALKEACAGLQHMVLTPSHFELDPANKTHVHLQVAVQHDVLIASTLDLDHAAFHATDMAQHGGLFALLLQGSITLTTPQESIALIDDLPLIYILDHKTKLVATPHSTWQASHVGAYTNLSDGSVHIKGLRTSALEIAWDSLVHELRATLEQRQPQLKHHPRWQRCWKQSSPPHATQTTQTTQTTRERESPYFPCSFTSIRALYPKTSWIWHATDIDFAHITKDETHLYVPTSKGWFALDHRTGISAVCDTPSTLPSLKKEVPPSWVRPWTNTCAGPITCDEDLVIIPQRLSTTKDSETLSLMAFEKVDHTLRWSMDLNVPSWANLSLWVRGAYGHGFIRSNSGLCACIDRTDGRIIWKMDEAPTPHIVQVPAPLIVRDSVWSPGVRLEGRLQEDGALLHAFSDLVYAPSWASAHGALTIIVCERDGVGEGEDALVAITFAHFLAIVPS